jgi:hypothetical protein
MEIEPRWVPNRPGNFIASNEDLVAACDENTIGARLWGGRGRGAGAGAPAPAPARGVEGPAISSAPGPRRAPFRRPLRAPPPPLPAPSPASPSASTPGVVAILGTTYTGHFYDVEELDALLEARNKETGWGLSIHVDGASGGFVAPFAYPNLKWCAGGCAQGGGVSRRAWCLWGPAHIYGHGGAGRAAHTPHPTPHTPHPTPLHPTLTPPPPPKGTSASRTWCPSTRRATSSASSTRVRGTAGPPAAVAPPAAGGFACAAGRRQP